MASRSGSVSSLLRDSDERVPERGVEGTLTVTIRDGCHLPFGLDPYFVVVADGQMVKTEVRFGTKSASGLYRFKGQRACFASHSKADVRVELWDRHRFAHDRLVGVGYVYHTQVFTAQSATPVHIRLFEPYLSSSAARSTVKIMSLLPLVPANQHSSRDTDTDNDNDSDENDDIAVSSEAGQPAFQKPTLGVQLTFSGEAASGGHSRLHERSQKEARRVLQAEMQASPAMQELLNEKRQRKRKEARTLALQIERMKAVPAGDRERMFKQLNALLGSGVAPSEHGASISETMATCIYSAWKEHLRTAVRTSASRPPLNDDCCYVCQDNASDWSDPLLQLKCTHLLHRECAAGQLNAVECVAGEPVNVANARCGICRRWLEHDMLYDRVLPIVQLYRAVATVAHAAWDMETGARDTLTSTAEIMTQLEFRTCAVCMRPFFAGRRECAEARADRAQPKICQHCAVPPGGHQPHCNDHGEEFIQWKCLWCCSAATFHCGGHYRYCERCHTTLDARVYPCPGPPECFGQHIPNDGNTGFCLGCGLCRASSRAPREVSNAGYASIIKPAVVPVDAVQPQPQPPPPPVQLNVDNVELRRLDDVLPVQDQLNDNQLNDQLNDNQLNDHLNDNQLNDQLNDNQLNDHLNDNQLNDHLNDIEAEPNKMVSLLSSASRSSAYSDSDFDTYISTSDDEINPIMDRPPRALDDAERPIRTALPL